MTPQPPEWWDAYRPYHTERFITFLKLEASASRLRTFQVLFVPGLLQTPGYAEAVLRTYHPEDDVVARTVEVRTRRQALLDARPGPEFYFVIDEAAVHRWVGGPEVVRRQLVRLEELDRRPNIHIQVLPFSAGAHPGMRGAFSLLEFPFDAEPPALLLEHLHEDVLVQDDRDRYAGYLDTFRDLEKIASPRNDLRKITQPILENLDR